MSLPDFREAWSLFNDRMTAYFILISDETEPEPDYLARYLKPPLELILKMIMMEECDKELGVQMGACLEFMVEQECPAVILGLAKAN